MDTKQTIELFGKYVIGNYTRLPRVIVKGSGSYMFDADGNKILDMFPGWAVSAIGHCHPKVVEAICAAFGSDWRPSHVPLYVAWLLGKSGDLMEKLFRTEMPINSARVRKLTRPLTFSCEKSRRVLGYEPTENLPEGISKEVEWLSTENGWK